MLAALRNKGARLARSFSNGTPKMLASAIGHAGLDGIFEHVLSIDGLQKYKTVPEAYRLVEHAMQVAPEDVSFQSSNRWDIAGAVRYGFRGVWINRAQGLPDEYDGHGANACAAVAGGVDSIKGGPAIARSA